MELFMGYGWPGNVRELENVLRQTLLLSPFTVILPENLPGKFRPVVAADAPLLSPLDTVERKQILQTLETTAWNQSRAAQRLGIDRKTLRTKILRYGLAKEGLP
jgi:transcriptional regulator of acetoin/glycerol metabolism